MKVTRVATPQEVLGDALITELVEARHQLLAWSAHVSQTTVNAWELADTSLTALRASALADEDWVFAESTNDSVLAYDQPSERGLSDPMAAVAYPELASRLWAWWITHAWRVTELAHETTRAIEQWSMAVSFTLARALLEEVASLAYEGDQLIRVWQTAKQVPATHTRPAEVRRIINLTLLKAFRGSRISTVPEVLKAVNVMTMVNRFEKMTGLSKVGYWYEWLSEASHPAYAAPTTYASVLMRHETGAVSNAAYSLHPSITESDGELPIINNQMRMSAECVIACVNSFLVLGPQVEAMVRDFELTTDARSLTRTRYVRGISMPADVGELVKALSHVWGSSIPDLRWH
jgi:hypothetical protein